MRDEDKEGELMVSIIILTHNHIKYTKECLESLFEYTSQVKTPYEIILVDNGSIDGTIQYLQGLEQAGKIKVIYNQENKGFPAANNQGASIAKGEYLCLCNNDIVFTDDWLEKLLRCMRSDSQVVAVGPYTSHSSGYQQVMPRITYKGKEELQTYARKFSGEEKYVDFLVFFCVLIKRKVWDELGGLLEKMGIGCYEDNLFCYRLIEKGYKLKIAGDAYIHHYSGGTFQQGSNSKKLEFYKRLMAHNQKLFLKEINRYETVGLSMICADSERPENLRKCLNSVADFVDSINIVFNYKNYPKPWRLKRLLRVVKEFENVTFDNTKGV